MSCPRCGKQNNPEAHRCAHCGGNLSVAMLEVVRGELPEKIYFLKPRSYTIGRGRLNDLCLSENSISKTHARIVYEGERFRIEDYESLHGIFVNTRKVESAELSQGALIQLGNVTLRFTLLGPDVPTEKTAAFPWIEEQQLLLSLVQAMNSTLVLSQVLDQVLDAVMRITRAERGFLFLADDSPETGEAALVAGLRLRVARRKGKPSPLTDVQGISSSVVNRALVDGETVATGNAALDPSLGEAPSVVLGHLKTIVCIPLRSPRAGAEVSESPVEDAASPPATLGVLYVDNHLTSAPFRPESLQTAEALARHAALAIENAQLFERERRTTQELRDTQQQLLNSEKLATIGQMAAGIAHELNTPLTYIKGNLELLGAHDLTEEQKQMLDSAEKGAERIRSLVHSLLAFSRPAGEEMVLLSPQEVVERSLEFCHYQILRGGVEVEKEITPSLPKVLGIATQLEMALINLVVNAVHAMEGGGRLKVTCGLREGGVEIAVADTGPGIPEEIQSKIFEPFFTTKAEGRGTGLGLSNVLMVVERHKGRIDFTSQAGVGTTFRIRLPAAT